MSRSLRQLPRNIRRASLFFKLFNTERLANIPLGILLFFAFVTLTVMVSFPAFISVERNETTLTRLLADKGFSLISALESVLRTGMRSQVGIRLQFLLEQLGEDSDVNFIAVTMPDGTIIAHTNRNRVGEILEIDGAEATEAAMHQLSPRGEKRWSVLDLEGTRSFVVYSNFQPALPDMRGRGRRHMENGHQGRGPGRGMGPGPGPAPGFRQGGQNRPPMAPGIPGGPPGLPGPPPRVPRAHNGPGGPGFPGGQLPVPMIFLGLDISPFDIARTQNRAYMTLLAGATLVAGLACLLVLYHTQKTRQSRLREKAARSRVAALEEEVSRKEKLAAVGNLAAGVAHEIRNPLSSIKGYATYFAARFPEGSEDREAASVMVREADRLNRVITELIGLSRPTDVSLKAVKPDDVIQHVARLLAQNAASRNVQIILNVPRRIPDVQADPDRLGQAMLNLCLNALDAMPRGGKLALSCMLSEGRICFQVKDNGTGIPEEDVSRVFDPYFTTKQKGTGIGLATVHKIVEAMHGEISVTSRQATERHAGETCFSIWLPPAYGPATA